MITLLERLVLVALQQDQALEALDFHHLVAVQDFHCAGCRISEGIGVKQPLGDAHDDSVAYNGKASPLSHFTVYLRENAGMIGKEVRIVVGHLDNAVAKLGMNSYYKKEYYDKLAKMEIEHKPHLLR